MEKTDDVLHLVLIGEHRWYAEGEYIYILYVFESGYLRTW